MLKYESFCNGSLFWAVTNDGIILHFEDGLGVIFYNFSLLLLEIVYVALLHYCLSAQNQDLNNCHVPLEYDSQQNLSLDYGSTCKNVNNCKDLR